jgi:hypothetical protein
MAEHAHDLGDHQHGHMPSQEQFTTYRDVMGLFKWGALAVADLIIVMTLWFCTAAGFLPAVIVGVIVAALGVVALRGIKVGAH